MIDDDDDDDDDKVMSVGSCLLLTCCNEMKRNITEYPNLLGNVMFDTPAKTADRRCMQGGYLYRVWKDTEKLRLKKSGVAF